MAALEDRTAHPAREVRAMSMHVAPAVTHALVVLRLSNPDRIDLRDPSRLSRYELVVG